MIVDANGNQISSIPDVQAYIGEFQPTPVAGGRSALKLRPGFSYMSLLFQFFKAGPAAMNDAEIDAAVSSIDLLIDGKQKLGLSTTVLRVINKFNTDLYAPLQTNSGFFPYWLARQWMEDEISQDVTQWGTGTTRNIEVGINWTGGSVCTACNLYAEVGPDMPLGRYLSIEKFQVAAVAGGDLPIFDVLLPTPDRSLYCMHVNDTGGVIDNFNILPDIGRTPPVFDKAGMDVNAWKVLLQKYQLSPQANYVHIAGVRRKRHADAIPLVPGMRIIPHLTGAAAGNSLTLYCEIAQGVQPK
jgi:hypothetical protein